MNRLTTAHVAAALALALALACGQAPDSAPSAEAPRASALRTTALSDSFNAYDSSTWEMANWANGNPFNCGFLPDHVTFANGAMTLKLDNVASSGKSYSGGEYRTKDTFSYGKFETRMKAAKASGIVSSFFTYTGSPWDEIDVEILGKNTSQAQFNYYVNGTGGHERLVDLGFDASAAYHTYTIDWQPNSISWYVDGVLKHTVTGGTLPSHPMQIMMNLWNGIGVDSWLGSFSYPGPLYASYDSVTYTPPGSTVTTYSLGVTKSGTGSGSVTSSPSGIDCGNTCSASFNSGTSVTLTPSAASGSTFAGWSGACTGSGTCIVTMTAAQSVTAAFTGPSTGGTVSIDVGGAAAGSFTADAYYSGGNTYATTKTIDTSGLSGSAPPQAVLQTERYGEFTYTIPGLTPGAAYGVTLYFVETYWTAAGQRTFNVAVNGNTVLSAFDIFATAGGANKAIARTFAATANGSGQVVIAFTKGGGPDNPKAVGITVTPGDPGTSSGGTSSGGTSSGGTSSGGTSSGGTSSGGTSSGGTSSGGTSSGGTSSGGTSSGGTSSGGTSSGGTSTCKAISGGQSGNFNTTGEICFTVSSTINGWGCSNVDGRTVTVNGTATTCGKLPLPGSAPYTFSFTGGQYPWASFYWW